MSDDRMEYDVLLIGGSPSNLALGHHLVDLAKESGVELNLAIMEKGADFGNHILSGAVSDPHVLKRLFPDYESNGFPIESVCTESTFSVMGLEKKWNVPNALLPSGLHKEGYLILTLSHVVKWMADKLEEKVSTIDNVNMDFLPGFAAHEIVFEGDSENPKVVGVQVMAEASGNADEDNIYGKVVCFGDKGFLSQDLIKKLDLRDNPQLWSVGVKEVWEIPEAMGKELKGKVWHTMGYPVMDGSFGGGFVYGMDKNRLTIGLVISLDSENPNINPQQALQDMKKHPWLQSLIKDGKLLKYGAATLPEGGYYSLPKSFAVDGAMLMGDALGVLNIGTLAGVDKAFECGWQAAEVLHSVFKDHDGDFSIEQQERYKTNVMATHVGTELKAGRYFRHAWKENPRLLKSYLPCVLDGIDNSSWLMGMINAGLKNNPFQALGDAMRLKGFIEGTADIGPLKYKKDHEHIQPDFKLPKHAEAQITNGFNKETLYSRVDAVFYANPAYHEENQHIDEFNADVCVNCIRIYDKLEKDTPCVSDCTAEVHRTDLVEEIRKHGMSLENCIQCRTCEFVCPEENLRVKAAEQGSGPDFSGL